MRATALLLLSFVITIGSLSIWASKAIAVILLTYTENYKRICNNAHLLFLDKFFLLSTKYGLYNAEMNFRAFRSCGSERGARYFLKFVLEKNSTSPFIRSSQGALLV